MPRARHRCYALRPAAPANRLQLIGRGSGANLSEALIVRLMNASGAADATFGTEGRRY